MSFSTCQDCLTHLSTTKQQVGSASGQLGSPQKILKNVSRALTPRFAPGHCPGCSLSSRRGGWNLGYLSVVWRWVLFFSFLLSLSFRNALTHGIPLASAPALLCATGKQHRGHLRRMCQCLRLWRLHILFLSSRNSGYVCVLQQERRLQLYGYEYS